MRVAYPPPVGPTREDLLPGTTAGGELALALFGAKADATVMILPWAGPFAVSRTGELSYLDAIGFMPAAWALLLQPVKPTSPEIRRQAREAFRWARRALAGKTYLTAADRARGIKRKPAGVEAERLRQFRSLAYLAAISGAK